MSRIHMLQHVPFEGPGSIAEWADRRGHAFGRTQLFAGEAPPDVHDMDWLVVMGGPMSVHDGGRYPWMAAEKEVLRQAVDAGIVIVGVCLGAQLLAEALGARVLACPHKEIGWFPVRCPAGSVDRWPPVAGVDRLDVFHWHGERFTLPEGAVHLFESEACTNQGFLHGGCRLGLQFHLEMQHEGCVQLIENNEDPLLEGPFVQDPESMLRDASRFDAANRGMAELLDGLDARETRKPE